MSRKFEVKTRTLVYSNQWMKVFENQIVRDGREGIYGVIERADSVIIVPVSPSRRTVLLSQYRFPTQSNSWELPMGGIDSEESSESAVRRELQEETGLTPGSVLKIGEYHVVPGLTPQRAFIFLAEVSDEDLDQQAPRLEEDEIQAAKVASLSDVKLMIEKGEITDGLTLAGFLYFWIHERAIGH